MKIIFVLFGLGALAQAAPRVPNRDLGAPDNNLITDQVEHPVKRRINNCEPKKDGGGGTFKDKDWPCRTGENSDDENVGEQDGGGNPDGPDGPNDTVGDDENGKTHIRQEIPPFLDATLTADPNAPTPHNAITDDFGVPKKRWEDHTFVINGKTVHIRQEVFETYATRPATKPNCACLTRAPLPLFKMIGNLHFKGIKLPFHPKQFYTTESTGPTACPPCDCKEDCYTTQFSTRKRPKAPCGDKGQ